MTDEGTLLNVHEILVWLFFSGAQGGGSWRHVDVTFWRTPGHVSHLEGHSIRMYPAGLSSPAVFLVPLVSSQPSQQQLKSKPELHQTCVTADALPNQDLKLNFY